jgi:sugar lactone lactonase YvrE
MRLEMGTGRALRTVTAALSAVALCALAPAGASALESCPTQPRVDVLYSGAGSLESVGVDRKGRIFFTDSTNGNLMRLRNDGRARVLTSGIPSPGGIVFKRNSVLVGYGDSVAQAADGPLNPEAGMLQVDPRTGKATTFVEGLQMANGIARGPDGRIFASNDVLTGIDLITKGKVELGWANVTSPNGLAVDRSKRFLFANQTFTAAAIQRIPIDNPGAPTTYFSAPPADIGAGLDGLERAPSSDVLYAAANGAGEVWKVSGPGDACVLATRVPFPDGPSDVAFTRGRGFADGTLLVVTFGGELLAIPGAA